MTRKPTHPRNGRNTHAAGHHDGADKAATPPIETSDEAAGPDRPDKPADYEVGYGKPPRHSQYEPGMSGYPQGRKKRARGRRAIFEMISKETVTIREGDRTKKMSREEAFQRHLWARAFADAKGVPPLLIFMRTVGAPINEETVNELQVTPQHEAIVADFVARYTAVPDPSDHHEDEPEPHSPACPKKEGDMS